MSVVLKNVSFDYPGKSIFKDFSQEFENGIFYSVSAASGKGKTTLFRLISGLEKPLDGTVSVSGKVSYMFQENRLFPTLSVMENVLLTSDGKSDAKKILKHLEIFEEKDALPKELSGGQKRRVALARALLAPFDNLLLDEPFTGLDPEIRDKAIGLICEMCKDKTLISATHDKDEREFCLQHITL